jgi:homoserine kinase type II
LQQLEAFLRFRYAVQGVYFAGRVATGNLTGVIDQAENARGLDHARRGLGALGIAG